MSLSCAAVRERLPDVPLGLDDDVQAIEAHLASCPSCAAVHASLDTFYAAWARETRAELRANSAPGQLTWPKGATPATLGQASSTFTPTDQARMSSLTPVDIELGRSALTRGYINRQALDQGVSLVSQGQATDLGQALLLTGGLTPAQLNDLRGQRSSVNPDAVTLHDGFGGGAPTYPDPGTGFGSAGGSAFGAPGGSGFGAPPSGSGFGAPPSGGFGAPPSGGFGAAPSGGFGAPPSGSGFGAPGGSGFGAPPSGFAPPPSGGFGAPGGSGFGSNPGGLAPAGGSGFGAPAGTGFGPPPGTGFGSAGSGFGAPAGTGFGSAGTGFGAPGGSAFGSAAGFPTADGRTSDGVGESIDGWVVSREVGRGGVGIVYEVTNEANRERAALKIMVSESGLSEKRVERFQKELERQASLDHPGIVSIKARGLFNGYPYAVTDFVAGKPLDRMLKDDLDLEIGMEILEAVAQALHYAHEQDIVHGDLKPSNVIVQEDMRPLLTDFGLGRAAKVHQAALADETRVTGTPYYFPPELIEGPRAPDRRSDIYSLGVIMYELATGRLPFVGQTPLELFQRVLHDDPVPPTKFKPQLTKALETVCLKAISKDPAQRYATAAEFAVDVRALLEGGTITAKAEGSLKRWVRQKRKRASVGLMIGISTVLLTVVVGGILLNHKLTTEKQRAERISNELGSRRSTGEEALATSAKLIDEAHAALAAGKIPDAIDRADRSREALESMDTLAEQLEFVENEQPVAKLVEELDTKRRALTAKTLLVLARAHMYGNSSDADKAETYLQEVERNVPQEQMLDLRLARADFYRHTGRLEDARKAYDEALLLQGDSVAAFDGKAETLFLLENYTDALQALKLAAEGVKGSDEEKKARQAEFVLRAAAVQLETGALAPAEKEIERARELNGETWHTLVATGRLQAARGLLVDARDTFDAARELAAKESPAAAAKVLTTKSESLLKAGRAVEAFEVADQAVNLDPSSVLPAVVRAEAAEAMLDSEQAKNDAGDVILRANPGDWRENARAYRVRARLAGAKGDLKEARELATEANKTDPYSAEGRLHLGRVLIDPYFENNYLDLAGTHFEHVDRHRADNQAAKRGMGVTRLHGQSGASGREKVFRDLREALKLDPEDPWARSALGRALLSKEDDEESAANAARTYSRAVRSERDVRRPEGWAYAVGLNQLKLARRTSGKQRQTHQKKAIAAFNRAVWIDPMHVQALTGLALIAHDRDDTALERELLKRVNYANPLFPAGILISAQHHCLVDAASLDLRAAMESIKAANEVCGDFPEVKVWTTFGRALELIERKDNASTEDQREVVEAAQEQFDALRKEDPWRMELYRQERQLLKLVLSPNKTSADNRALINERLRALRIAEQDRQEAIEKNDAAVDVMLEAVRSDLDRDAVERETTFRTVGKAAQQAPYRADAWHLLAQVYSRLGDPWGALGAEVRAAYIDDRYVGELFPILRLASGTDKDIASAQKRLVELNQGLLPFPPDLKTLLEVAPVVARSMGTQNRPEAAETKPYADQLTRAIEFNPNHLLAHALLGALAYGVQQEAQALQHLLFVGKVAEHTGEAFYLAALVVANSDKPETRTDVLAIEWLQEATNAGFAWPALAKDEPRLARLKKTKLWDPKRLPEISGIR
ncbi:MAG: protein kinase [Planctomycetes bacterium]|nr:protein kinase [Planctomycetota bacterium]